METLWAAGWACLLMKPVVLGLALWLSLRGSHGAAFQMIVLAAALAVAAATMLRSR